MLRRGRTNLMWDNTRLVVFAAICASLYAAILIPFKVLPLIPGVTELRPANAVPVICSFLFGPAAGWGAAIGNIIGDFFGGLGPGDFFGFLGNIVLFNNFVSSMLFAPLLLAVIYPRVARGRLLYHHLLAAKPAKPRPVRLLGLALLTGATVGGLVA